MPEVIAPPLHPEHDSAIIMLAGPIKYWWDENWGTPQHNNYVAWRDHVNDGLVKDGYLVYRPHEAFKGRWDERAQSVNDTALLAADVICNLTPPGIPSLGTDGEILYATNNGNALIVNAPPTGDFDKGVTDLLTRLHNLDIHRKLIEQEVVIESIPMRPGRGWMLNSASAHFEGQVLRLHHFDDQHRIEATDARSLSLIGDATNASDTLIEAVMGQLLTVSLADILKLEVLQRQAISI